MNPSTWKQIWSALVRQNLLAHARDDISIPDSSYFKFRTRRVYGCWTRADDIETWNVEPDVLSPSIEAIETCQNHKKSQRVNSDGNKRDEMAPHNVSNVSAESTSLMGNVSAPSVTRPDYKTDRRWLRRYWTLHFALSIVAIGIGIFHNRNPVK